MTTKTHHYQTYWRRHWH